MGIFSTKKKVQVASVVYNMAGPEEDRPNFLKSIVLGNMVSRGQSSMGNSIVNNYLNGPGLKLRSFYRWSENHYPSVGIPRDTFSSTRELSLTTVGDAISALLGDPVKIDWVEMGRGDPAFWAMQWMYANMPEKAEDDWEADYTAGDTEGTITFDDGVTEPVTFPIGDYSKTSDYIYASYIQNTGSSTDALITGPITTLGVGEEFPSTAGWISTGSSLTPYTRRLQTIVTTVLSYSDGRPNETSSVVSETTAAYEKYIGVFLRTTYNGVSGADRTSTREYMTLVQDREVVTAESVSSSSEVVSGVTVTTTVTTHTQSLSVIKTVRIDSQTIHLNTWSEPTIFIYERGSGVAELDSMFVSYEQGDGYFPLIPLRLNNQFVSDTYQPTLYEESQKAYKKIFGADYNELIENIADNPKLGDIDYAYVVFGVNMNTKDNEGKQYIYEYFHRLMGQQQSTIRTDMGNWEDTVYAEYQSNRENYEAWMEEQIDIGETGTGDYSPEPTYPSFQSPPVTELRIKTNSSVINFDMQIDWDTIKEVTGTGLGKPGAKAGDLWFTGEASDPLYYLRILNPPSKEKLYRKQLLTMWWQVTDDSWKKLEIYGLVNRNFIWDGKSVNTWGIEALLDEDESAFIVPLHYEVYKKLPMKVATQLSTSCAHILFNCYVITKEKWYQRGIFKIFMFIAAVVITIINPPAGLAAFAAAIGVPIIVAAIIIVAANMIAAMILMKIITPVAIAIFGEKVGQIVSAIASFTLMVMSGNFFSTGSFATSWSALMNPMNLLLLTNAIGNGIASMMQVESQEYAQKTQVLMENYENQLDELAKKYKDVLGDGFSYIDPMDLTDSSFGYYESSETFLSRTLLTGSDIAELSHTLLSGFPEITLRLDTPV
jgi:hypothetical protein